MKGYACAVLALSLVALGSSKVRWPNWKSFTCSTGKALDLTPTKQCTHFHICIAGREIRMKCPFNQHFNKRKRRCEHPSKAGCRARPAKKKEKEVANAVFLPHSDCSKFYSVIKGRKVAFDCPRGLHFNKDLTVCERPNEAGCESPTELAKRQAHLCPPGRENETLVIFVPHRNCGEYYACVAGEQILMQCPPGMHFSQDDNGCASAEGARCRSKRAVRDCDEFFEGKPMWNMKDCSRYWFCQHGTKRLVLCQPNKYYDPRIGNCTTEAKAFCGGH